MSTRSDLMSLCRRASAHKLEREHRPNQCASERRQNERNLSTVLSQELGLRLTAMPSEAMVSKFPYLGQGRESATIYLLPTASDANGFPEAGGLMFYGPD